jgi:hypothetical protein
MECLSLTPPPFCSSGQEHGISNRQRLCSSNPVFQLPWDHQEGRFLLLLLLLGPRCVRSHQIFGRSQGFKRILQCCIFYVLATYVHAHVYLHLVACDSMEDWCKKDQITVLFLCHSPLEALIQEDWNHGYACLTCKALFGSRPHEEPSIIKHRKGYTTVDALQISLIFQCLRHKRCFSIFFNVWHIKHRKG